MRTDPSLPGGDSTKPSAAKRAAPPPGHVPCLTTYGATDSLTHSIDPHATPRVTPELRAPSLRRQRVVSANLFSLFGYMFGHFFSQLPVTKTRLHVSDARFGMLLFADGAGNLIAQSAASRFPNMLQSSRCAPITGAVVMSAAGFANLSTTQTQFVASLGAMGAASSLFDIAINIQLVALSKASGEPEASFFHGLFSAAELLGGGVGAALTEANISFTPRIAITSMTLASASLLHLPIIPPQALIDEVEDLTSPAEDAQKKKAILMLATISMLSAIGEGALGQWAGIYLKQDLHSNFTIANSAAFACSLGMTVSRFAGSRIIKRCGVRPTLIAGSAVAAVAVAVGLASDKAIPFLVATGIAGAGLANMTPLTMTALTSLSDEEQAAAVTKVTIAQQVGFFAGPPLIGAIAGAAGLRYALGLVSATSVVIGLTSMFLNLNALVTRDNPEV